MPTPAHGNPRHPFLRTTGYDETPPPWSHLPGDAGPMVTVRPVPEVATLQLLLLVALGAGLGWGPRGWVAAYLSLVVADVAAVRLARSYGVVVLGPADVVTLTRTALTCGVVAVMVEQSLASSPRSASVAALAALALALDRADGWVARRTGTASAFGGRIDGEADAYLLLVLSVWVAATVGWWVLIIGLARYAFAAAGWVLPWLRAQLPFRYWRKVVTAVAGTALVVAAADVVPAVVAQLGLVAALLLIGESFGRDTWWLWSHHAPVRHAEPAAGGPG